MKYCDENTLIYICFPLHCFALNQFPTTVSYLQCFLSHVKNAQHRDDYLEFIRLSLAFLGKQPTRMTFELKVFTVIKFSSSEVSFLRNDLITFGSHPCSFKKNTLLLIITVSDNKCNQKLNITVRFMFLRDFIFD